ncbi:DUF3999 family protein [Winogradskyella sediminis]|uniref:DUF3999 family protein n=1 Tax=Winogradskyella sediminis TaxID=1382466 RepID=UPI000E220516|nr:DUF3999 family protein [Winogradskyella sediminis]REG86054.1 uncharacterized protein DUF3999 [Winogradskyella sediminis]
MTSITKIIIGLCVGFTTLSFAQMKHYGYKRSLQNVSNDWHQLTIPEAVFGKLNSEMSDLRIYGITAQTDTIEAPYVLKALSEKIEYKALPFKIINKTKGEKGHYFTFQLNSEALINHIELDFKRSNFDWKIELQGSQNQQEWFTILEDYRILSIKNQSTNFKFTTLEFPDSKFKYYRLIVKDNEPPQLESAQLSNYQTIAGHYTTYNLKKLETTDDKTLKNTVINLELEKAVPLSQLHINVSNTFDYYRPFKIEYRRDSTLTEKGFKYHYKTITSGTLNSMEQNLFKFPSTIAKHLRVTIYNDNNQPLRIADVSAKGYQFQLIVRFTEPAIYMLVYGYPSAREPVYDIAKFETNIPEELIALEVGKEDVILHSLDPKVQPLFENSYWLWAIIGVVILLLGGFTLKMLKTMR